LLIPLSGAPEREVIGGDVVEVLEGGVGAAETGNGVGSALSKDDARPDNKPFKR
jgi:hypothetical protein